MFYALSDPYNIRIKVTHAYIKFVNCIKNYTMNVFSGFHVVTQTHFVNDATFIFQLESYKMANLDVLFLYFTEAAADTPCHL